MPKTKNPSPTVVNDASFFACRHCNSRVWWRGDAWTSEDGQWGCMDADGSFGSHQGREVTDTDILVGLQAMLAELGED